MSSTTPNLGLIKPAEAEVINIADINTNSDKIDVSYKNMVDQAKQLAEQIKTAQETLNNMNGLIQANKNAITQLNSELEIKHVNVPIDETYVTREQATRVTYYKFGKIILLYFYDIHLKPGFPTENVATIASGLPVPSPGMIPTAVAHAHDTVIRVSVAHDGKLKPWYVGNTTDTVFSGQIIYTIQ